MAQPQHQHNLLAELATQTNHVAVLSFTASETEVRNLGECLLEVANLCGSHVAIFRGVIDAEFARMAERGDSFMVDESLADIVGQSLTSTHACSSTFLTVF